MKTQESLITYVVKRGQPVEKYVGYKKERTYDTNENLGVCDCEGFSHTTHCKHLRFKAMLDETTFKGDEMVFFGENVGDPKPKTENQISDIMLELLEPLEKHFNIVDIDVNRYVATPVNPNLFTAIEFRGKRKKPTQIVGYFKGILFWLRPDPI